MAVEAPIFDPVQESGISLLPRLIRVSTGVHLPSDPNNPEAVHAFMKSEVLHCPERAMAEARIILDKGTTELLNTKYGDCLESLGIDKNDLAVEGKENLRPRREGIGRKRRAQFSIKPVVSQPSENLEPNFDVSQIQDPVEFFAAFERLEFAKKEMRILKGETSNLSDYDPPLKRRERRPGIQRKSTNYKHRYSSIILESEDMHTSTQESVADDALASQGHDKLRPETSPPNPEQEEIDVEGSLNETENKVSEILDELVSQENEEQLQMKPIDLGDLSIPDFPEMGRTNFKALRERLPRTRKSYSNIGGSLAKTSLGVTPKNGKQGIASPSNLIGSPTPPKSPFASISQLKKRTSLSDTQRDPFLPLNVDFSEQRNSYFYTNIDKETHEVSSSEPNMSGKRSQDTENDVGGSQVFDTDIERAGCVSVIVSPLDKSINQVTDTDLSPHRSQDMMEQRSEMNMHGETNMFDISEGQEETEKDSSSMLADNLHEKTNMSDISKGQEETEKDSSSVLADNLHGKANMPDISEDQEETEKDSSSMLADNLHGKTSMSDISEGQEETEKDSSSMLADNLHEKTNMSDISEGQEETEKDSSSVLEDNLSKMYSKGGFPADQAANDQESDIMDILIESRPVTDEMTWVAVEKDHINTPSNVAETNAEQNLQEHHSKMKRSQFGVRIKKAHPLRPSLADAGTFFEMGVRRSKRIKTRPLKYWKGERLLYGRVDQSLKLIGMKYISPAKGDGILKVKSYVPDEYKKILEIAAAH